MTAPDRVCLASADPARVPRHCEGEPEPNLPLCRPCLDHAGAAVALLVHDFRDLEQLLPRPLSVWSDGLPRGGGEAPVPLRLDVEALQAEIWWLCTAWAEVLTDVHRLADAPSPVRRGFAVQWAVGVIGPRVQVLALVLGVVMVGYPGAAESVSTVDGAQGLLDLASAHARARSVLGLTEPTYVLPGRCQVRGCGAAQLRVRDGSDTVWCERCGASMTRDDYDRYGNVFLRTEAAA